MNLAECKGKSMGFPGGLVVKISPANTGDTRDVGLIPGLRRSYEVGSGNSLQSSCWENSMNRGPGRLQSMGKSRLQLSD